MWSHQTAFAWCLGGLVVASKMTPNNPLLKFSNSHLLPSTCLLGLALDSNKHNAESDGAAILRLGQSKRAAVLPGRSRPPVPGPEERAQAGSRPGSSGSPGRPGTGTQLTHAQAVRAQKLSDKCLPFSVAKFGVIYYTEQITNIHGVSSPTLLFSTCLFLYFKWFSCK